MKPRSDYSYRVDPDGSVFIRDMNMGRMSVTNDVENVLLAIHETIDLTGRKVTYRDSDGQIDTVLHEAGVFKGFQFGG
jgi:hypothetical protein